MTTKQLAHYIWDFLRRHDGERSADECWFLAESILSGNRPNWLFDVEGGTAKFTDFKPFTT
jgi:hypothetical protein